MRYRSPSICNFRSAVLNLQLPRSFVSMAVALFAVAWPSHAAYEVAIDRQQDAERQLLADAIDGRLDGHSLVEGALIAGGTTRPQALKEQLRRFDEIAQELSASLHPGLSDRDKACAIHAYLHERVLREYTSDASDVAKTLTSGVYNCVSASVLFVALAEQSGLKAHAVQLPEHVRCEVMTDGVAITIETTSHNAAVQRGSRKRSRLLNDVTLVATLYYNRGVAAFDNGDLPAAISLNEIAVDLDPACRPARENLLAAINNRVVELMKNDAKNDALQLLDRGLRIEPGYRPFQVNRAYLTQKSS